VEVGEYARDGCNVLVIEVVCGYWLGSYPLVNTNPARFLTGLDSSKCVVGGHHGDWLGHRDTGGICLLFDLK
jgi:hypothetical protein